MNQSPRRTTKNDGVTAVNSEFNFPKRRIWFWAHRDGDVILENADVCSQRNSVSGSCSARLAVFLPSIRKEERGSDCENIDARWRKRDGREFRLRFSRLLISMMTGLTRTGFRWQLSPMHDVRLRVGLGRVDSTRTGFRWRLSPMPELCCPAARVDA